MDRLLAAGYAGHWQLVRVDWPQLARKKKLLDLPLGRACLEAGSLPEAELHVRSTLDAERRWGNKARRANAFRVLPDGEAAKLEEAQQQAEPKMAPRHGGPLLGDSSDVWSCR
jgi:hypothetical protein